MEAREYTLMDAAEDHTWWYRGLHVRLLDQLFEVQGSILDAGCGTGGFLMQLRTQHPTIRSFGCDRAEGAARRAAHKSGALISCGTVGALPFVSESFDAVVAADVLCHAAVLPRPALEEFARVLRPGGSLVVNMPAYQWLLSAHDRRVHNILRVTTRSLHLMLTEVGFHEIRTWYWNCILFPVMVAQRKLRSRRLGAMSDVRPFPSWLNRTLCGVLAAERRLPFRMPFGGSVMATATKARDYGETCR